MSLQKEAQGGDGGFTSNKLSLDEGQKLALCVINHVFSQTSSTRIYHTTKQARLEGGGPLCRTVSVFFLTLAIPSRQTERALCVLDLRAETRGEEAHRSQHQNELEMTSPLKAEMLRPAMT